MIKKVFVIFLFCLLFSPLILSEEGINEEDSNSNITIKDVKDGLKESSKTNAWNETVIISPTWQKVMGGFFGLNLKKESSEISVREALVFFMIFILFLIIIWDILRVTGLFDKQLLFFSGNFVAALIITFLVSITGAFISLKDIFINGIHHTLSSLNWEWINWAIQNPISATIITLFIGVPLIILIHEIITWVLPKIKKISKVSMAKAKGRRLNEAIQRSED